MALLAAVLAALFAFCSPPDSSPDLPAAGTASGTGASKSLWLTASSTCVDISGGHGSATLTARVLDASGRPAEGEQVVFSTDFGTFAGASGDGMEYKALTSLLGFAQALIISKKEGAAVVTARRDTESESTNIVFAEDPAATARFVLFASPDLLYPGSISAITASLTDRSGNPICSYPISFVKDDDESAFVDAGGRRTRTGENEMVVRTNDEGVAAINLVPSVPSEQERVVLISATVQMEDGARSEFLSIRIVPESSGADIARVSLSFDSVQQDDLGNRYLVVHAAVEDSAGRPVSGAVVRFAADQGSIQGFAVTGSEEGQEGIATAIWYLGEYGGQATLTAYAGEAEDQLVVDLSEWSTTPLSITPASATLRAAGESASFRVLGGTKPYTAAVSEQGYLSVSSSDQDDGAVVTVTATSMPSGFVSADLTVVDQNGTSVTAEVDLDPRVSTLLGISPPEVALYGEGDSIQFTASGGVPPYSFSLSHPDFLSGDVVTDGAYLVTVTATPSVTVVASVNVTDAAASVATAYITLYSGGEEPEGGGLVIVAAGGAHQLVPGGLLQFVAAGGAPAYTWTANGGLWDTNGDGIGDSDTTTSTAGQPVTYQAGSKKGGFFIFVVDSRGTVARYGITIE